MMHRRSILQQAGCGLAALVLTMAAAPARSQEAVNIYNARHYGTDQQLWDGFADETGIKVNVIEGSHEQLLQRLRSEGRNSPADVFITVDAGRLAEAAATGLLEPIRSAALEGAIPPALRDPQGLWFGLAKRARVLIYAKDRVANGELSTYEALAEPRFKDRVLVRSSTSVYNLSLVGAILEANGPERTLAWCEGLVANMARPPEGGDTDQIKAVAAGVGDVAISNTYYFARLSDSKQPADQEIAQKLGVFFPNQGDRGTHVNISGAAVLKTAPNRANATRLLEYLAAPEAQRYFADVSLEYPANPAVEPHPVLKSWGSFKEDPLNAASYAARSEEASRLMDRCGWR
jgi:iron(III) transport system substrate-binding protein